MRTQTSRELVIIPISIIAILIISLIGVFVFVNSDNSYAWKKECVNGQLVYTKNNIYKGFAVNAMEDGKEVKCNSEYY